MNDKKSPDLKKFVDVMSKVNPPVRLTTKTTEAGIRVARRRKLVALAR